MGKITHIAIDGPSGAGKSTIAKCLAKKLHMLYLDTGAMYRSVGLKAIRNHLDTHSEEQLSKMLTDTTINIQFDEGEQRIYLDGKDVSSIIRTPEVSKAASDVSKWPTVRLNLVKQQRVIAEGQSVVMDGRDIGTYVLPNADFKFFMTASSAVRAKRRHLQLKEMGQDKPVEDIEQEIIARDEQDMNRVFAPLRQAEDAIFIDTSELSIDEVVQKMLDIIGQ